MEQSKHPSQATRGTPPGDCEYDACDKPVTVVLTLVVCNGSVMMIDLFLCLHHAAAVTAELNDSAALTTVAEMIAEASGQPVAAVEEIVRLLA